MLICMALLEYSVCSPAFASVRGFDPHGKSDSAAEEALGEGTQLQSIDSDELLTSHAVGGDCSLPPR